MRSFIIWAFSASLILVHPILFFLQRCKVWRGGKTWEDNSQDETIRTINILGRAISNGRKLYALRTKFFFQDQNSVFGHSMWIKIRLWRWMRRCMPRSYLTQSGETNSFSKGSYHLIGDNDTDSSTSSLSPSRVFASLSKDGKSFYLINAFEIGHRFFYFADFFPSSCVYKYTTLKEQLHDRPS